MIKTETGYMITRDDLDADGWYKASDGLIVEGNLKEFPDDGSEQSEERVRAFEFAKSIALELKPR